MAEKPQSSKKTKLKIKSWYSDRHQSLALQRNILLLFTMISMVSVTFAVFYVKNIMSSKSLDPYIIEVEEKTGIATVVTQLTAQNFTGDQAVRRYFINTFVHAANGYDPKTYKQDLEIVRLLSSPGVYSDFRSRINPKELGPESSYEVRIKSIQFPDPNTAQIRTSRQIKLPNTDPKMKDEIITMGFYFSPEMNLTMEERLINPLGFQINKYIIADEVFSY